MKRILVFVLLCINFALLGALLLGALTPKATAQVTRGGSDYLMITGHVGQDWDAVYVIDLGRRRMLGWKFNQTKKRLEPLQGRLLQNDFRRTNED